MKLLAIETSSPLISVAILRDGKTVGDLEQEGNASVLLVPMIHATLAQAGMSLGEIDVFAIGEGPGSYNGLRCGFATVAGILLPNPKPVIQVNSLASQALMGCDQKKLGGVILNARKNMFFYQIFRFNGLPKLEKEAMVGSISEIPTQESDTSWTSYEVPGFHKAYPCAVTISAIALPLAYNKQFSPKLGEPRYLRSPV